MQRQEVLVAAQGVHRGGSLGGELLEIICLFGGLGPGQTVGGLDAVGGDVGVLLLHGSQEPVHIGLQLEGALLLLAAAELHHQEGEGAEDALAGEAALAHGHALEDALDLFPGQVEAAVQKAAAQIQGLLSDAAGAEFEAALFVSRQIFRAEGLAAQGYGGKVHGDPP